MKINKFLKKEQDHVVVRKPPLLSWQGTGLQLIEKDKYYDIT